MKTVALGLLVGALLVAGCGTTQLGRRQLTILPDAQMTQMGDKAFADLKASTPIETDPRPNQYVQCVAGAITREIGGSWEIVVFREQTPNAFALPGGKIGVHTAMLSVAANQHQLAAVIAHEVGHVLSKHSNERSSQQMATQQGINLIKVIAAPSSSEGQLAMGALGIGAQYGILLPFSRLQESEADLVGLDLMAKAGFDPSASVELWKNMEHVNGKGPAEFLSTHPSGSTRIQDLEKRIPQAQQLSSQAMAAGKRPQCDNFR